MFSKLRAAILLRLAVWLKPYLMEHTVAPVIIFDSEFTESRELDGCRCSKCLNRFWIEHAMIEIPNHCPYCGVVFMASSLVDGWAFNEDDGRR